MNRLLRFVYLYCYLFVSRIVVWDVVLIYVVIFVLLILIWVISYVVIDYSHVLSLHLWFVIHIQFLLFFILFLLKLLFLNHPCQLKRSRLVYPHELIIIIIANLWLILELNNRTIINTSHVLLLLLIDNSILW